MGMMNQIVRFILLYTSLTLALIIFYILYYFNYLIKLDNIHIIVIKSADIDLAIFNIVK